jgi:hypothetical protein
MTIHFQPNPNTASLPDQSVPGSPFPSQSPLGKAKADTQLIQSAPPGATPTQPLPPAALLEHRVPVTAPPSGDTDPATRQHLVDKFSSLVNNPATPAGDGAQQNPSPQPFDIDAVLQLLVKESADGFKMAATQTQLATTEKVEFLTGEASDIRSAGSDRMVGSILAGVGSVAQGLTALGGAGVSARGATLGNAEVGQAETQLQQQYASDPQAQAQNPSPPVLDPTTRATLYNQGSAKWTNYSQITSSSGAVTQGGFNIGQGDEESKATREDAAKADAEKGATEEDALHDNASAMKQQYLSVMQDYVEKRKSLEQSRDETMKAVARA